MDLFQISSQKQLESNLMKCRMSKHRCCSSEKWCFLKNASGEQNVPWLSKSAQIDFVFIQPEHSQVRLHGWNIPVPRAQTHPPLCISWVPQQQHSFPFLLPWCSGILSQQVIAALWESLGLWQAVVRSGKDWAVLPGEKGCSWSSPGAFTQPWLLQQAQVWEWINICMGATAEEKSPLNCLVWRHREWNFKASEAQAALIFQQF